MTSLTSRTRVLALLGDPVDHSMSPIIQNVAFREAGVDGVYVALRCDASDLVGFMLGLGRAGSFHLASLRSLFAGTKRKLRLTAAAAALVLSACTHQQADRAGCTRDAQISRCRCRVSISSP